MGKTFSFSAKFFIDNTYGSAEMGFSGAAYDNSLRFSFNDGRMTDPSGKFFNSYLPSGILTLSGNFNTGTYDYYVNNVLNFSNGIKDDFVIDKFFINTSDCSIDGDIYVYGEKHDISTTMASSFTDGGTLTGTITNNSFSDLGTFWVFAGEVVHATDLKYFEIDSSETTFPFSVDASKDIAIKNVLFESELVELDLKLSGSFGEYENIFLLSGVR